MVILKRLSGQALVEWAIVFPVFIILAFGTCQWCLLQLNQNFVTHAAWKAARAQLVWESPFDAAAITLLPVAGWSPTLNASIQSKDEFKEIQMVASEENKIHFPGWSDFSRSHLIEDRVRVNVLEDDWEKATCEVIFRSEILFPFVDIFFAESQKNLSANYPENFVSSDSTIGFSSQLNEFNDSVIFKAENFVDLKARATVIRIDRPKSQIDFGEWTGGLEWNEASLLFLNSHNDSNWEIKE